MLLVIVTCDHKKVPQSYRKALSGVLTNVISKAFSPKLGVKGIVFNFQIATQFRPSGEVDRHNDDIDITIFAPETEENIAKLDDRVLEIRNAVGEWCDDSVLKTELGRVCGRIRLMLCKMAVAELADVTDDYLIEGNRRSTRRSTEE